MMKTIKKRKLIKLVKQIKNDEIRNSLKKHVLEKIPKEEYIHDVIHFLLFSPIFGGEWLIASLFIEYLPREHLKYWWEKETKIIQTNYSRERDRKRARLILDQEYMNVAFF